MLLYEHTAPRARCSASTLLRDHRLGEKQLLVLARSVASTLLTGLQTRAGELQRSVLAPRRRGSFRKLWGPSRSAKAKLQHGSVLRKQTAHPSRHVLQKKSFLKKGR